MERFRYGRSSKWLLDHHGDLILFLGHVRDIAEWRTRQAEIVQPRKLPDGLLEVRRQQESRFRPYIVEIETYAACRHCAASEGYYKPRPADAA